MKLFIVYRVITAVVSVFQWLMPAVMEFIEKLVRAKDEVIGALEDDNKATEEGLRAVKDKAALEVEEEVMAKFSESPPFVSRGVIRMMTSAIAYIVSMQRSKKRTKEMERQERAVRRGIIKGDGSSVKVFGVDININPGLAPPILDDEPKGTPPKDYLDVLYSYKKEKRGRPKKDE